MISYYRISHNGGAKMEVSNKQLSLNQKKTHKKNIFLGTLFALSAGVLWGLGGICAQFLFNSRGLTPQWVTTVRLIASGLTLLTIGYFKTGKDIFKIWTHKKDRFNLVLFAVFGMMSVQFTFLTAISHSNAATTTVIQYLAPALVLIFVSLKNKKLPSIIEFVAVILSIVGVFLLVTHGDFSNLVISKIALFWCIGAALSLTYYTIKPSSFNEKWSNYSQIGWAMLIGGLVCNIINPIWNIAGTFDIWTNVYLLAVVILGTLLPFTIYSIAVSIIGPTNASLYSCVEPVATAIMSVIFMGVSFEFLDWIGTSLIVSMVIILSLKKK